MTHLCSEHNRVLALRHLDVSKILTPLSGFGFILCRKKRRLKCCIVYTDKHVHVVQIQYKQHNVRGQFFMAHFVFTVFVELVESC